MRSTRAIVLSGVVVAMLMGVTAHAQEAGELPPGHPPMGDAPPLPPDHPPVGEARPEAGEVPPGHPPMGEAEASGEVPPGHPPVDDGATQAAGDVPPGHPPVADPHGGGAGGARPHDDMRRAFAPPEVAHAQPSDALAPGTIRVRVADQHGQPVAGADVQLGVMRQGGDRERTPMQTGEDGIATYSGLPTGSGQAYRINVLYEGATYSSTPFQLPPERGYDVRVTRLPVTHDDRIVLQLVGQTLIEIREARLHVIQQMQLANLGDSTYVFPDGGVRVELPEGYLAFQTQPVMTDQHVEELAGQGYRIRGSLPPGRVNLAWAFDLPITGTNMEVTLGVPFRTYIYRVITDAPPGFELDVDGMPRAMSFEDDGRALLGTEMQRSPGDAALEEVTISLRGIPGPGPARWIAVALASGLLALGILLAARGGKPGVDAATAARERRRKELLQEAAWLDEELASGEIGPEYRQKRRDAIVRELALILYQEEASAPKPAAKAKAGAETAAAKTA